MVQRIQEDCEIYSFNNSDMSILKNTQDAGT